jgi:hypothetical protein
VEASEGASITLIGAKTTVHHNCTRRERGEFGLLVSWTSSSTILLVSPLTKEQVAVDNGGGRNWGAIGGGDIHQIKTIHTNDGNVKKKKKKKKKKRRNKEQEQEQEKRRLETITSQMRKKI